MIRFLFGFLLAWASPAQADHLTAEQDDALETIQTLAVELSSNVARFRELHGAPTPVPDPQPDPEPDDPDPVRADWQCYLDNNPDVARVGKNMPSLEAWANDHYNRWGKKEGRSWGCNTPAGPGSPRLRFSHYNASAWHDRGVALILCRGDRASRVRIDGKSLSEHGGLDKGRYVYADYRTRGLTGLLEFVIDGDSYQVQITDRGVTHGECWRQ